MRYKVLSRFTSMGIIIRCINGLRKYVDKYISGKHCCLPWYCLNNPFSSLYFLPPVSRVALDPGMESLSSLAPSTTSTLSRAEATTAVTSNFESPSLPVNGKPSGESFHAIPFSDQLHDRLNLIHFLATESENLTRPQLDLLWNCLIVDMEVEHETSSFTDIDSFAGGSSISDILEGRNVCFKWFSPTSNILVHPYACSFFNENVMMIKPEMITPAGME